MDKCQSCKYFTRDDSTGSCDCLRMDFLNNLEVENYINAETQDCSQFEPYDGEDEYHYFMELLKKEEMGGFLDE